MMSWHNRPKTDIFFMLASLLLSVKLEAAGSDQLWHKVLAIRQTLFIISYSKWITMFDASVACVTYSIGLLD